MGLTVLAVSFLAVGELAVRVFFPQPDFFSRSDDRIGVMGIPNVRGRMRSPEFTTRVDTNSLGFRDRERSVEKARGARRVLVLGDSFTEGLQVEYEQTFHALLEDRLRAKLGPSLDVVSMGLPGVGTAHETLLYEALGHTFSPDVVLVAWFSGNDLWDNQPAVKYYYPGFKLGPGPDELVPVPWRKPVGSEGLLGDIVRGNRSQLLSCVARAYRLHWLSAEATRFFLKKASPTEPGTIPASTPGAVDATELEGESWEITRRILKRLRDATARQGATLVVGMIPPRWELDRHVTGQHVAALCGALGIRSVDLAPALRSARQSHPDEALYFPVDAHFTPSGHAAIVAPLYDTIEPLLAGVRSPP